MRSSRRALSRLWLCQPSPTAFEMKKPESAPGAVAIAVASSCPSGLRRSRTIERFPLFMLAQ